MTETGRVWLVGAGPGDPRLITIAGIDVLSRAEVVVYDRLVSPLLVDLAPTNAERIFVGKHPTEKDASGFSQQQINDLLVAKAREGKRVVRLKGGDPFVFGRGGEEAEALAAAGIPFEIVPGVSSAIAAPAYAGIPLTHRRMSSSFTVVTGHEDPDKAESAIDWERVAKGADTLVILMGGANLGEIMKRLAECGRAPDEPVAVVRWGTTPDQRVVAGSIADVAVRVAEAGLTPPLVTVVGPVVRLRDTLRWFDNRPPFGKRVLVTRAAEQAGVLSHALAETGAEPIELPAIEIVPRIDRKALRQAFDRLDAAEYDWLVFSSVNGVDIFFDELHRQEKDARALGRARVCAIGPATAIQLVRHGVHADLLPVRYLAEGVVEALSAQDMTGKRVLWPRARGARRALVVGLERLGATVDELPLYSAAVPKEVDAEAMSRLRAGEVDVVTFASSSAVRNLLKMLGGDRTLLEKPLMACIGPITAATARRAGLRVDVEAPEHTVEGLLSALRTDFETPQPRPACR
ncbi:MAG TPA: uroporphyrinogen-III C-methyltransferase [Dehalococcoidia bacterium]|nr:uroporphyrinogen-III C-methyltransferase [Dehalococcoidia bacterium]